MVLGDFDLSPEQLEDIAAEIKEKNRLYLVDYYIQRRETDYEGLRETARRADARYRTTVKHTANQRRFEERTRASKKHYCETCDYTDIKPNQFEKHLKSRRHKSLVAEAEASVYIKCYCNIFKYSCNKPSVIKAHNECKRHLERVAEAEAGVF